MELCNFFLPNLQKTTNKITIDMNLLFKIF